MEFVIRELMAGSWLLVACPELVEGLGFGAWELGFFHFSFFICHFAFVIALPRFPPPRLDHIWQLFHTGQDAG
jgi:hypothetical protein